MGSLSLFVFYRHSFSQMRREIADNQAGKKRKVFLVNK
jgi:hypothetical protein